MASGEFEVHASAFPVTRLVLDSHVRDGNLSSHDLQPVRAGDGMFGRGKLAIVVAVVDEFRQVFASYNAEFSKLHQRRDFGVAQAIRSATKFVDSAGFRRAKCDAIQLVTRWVGGIARCRLANLIGFAWLTPD